MHEKDPSIETKMAVFDAIYYLMDHEVDLTNMEDQQKKELVDKYLGFKDLITE